MSTRIADTIAGVKLVGQEGTLAALKGKLKNPHAGETKGIPKVLYLRSDQP